MKKNFLFKVFVSLIIGLSLTGCPQNGQQSGVDNQDNPDTPVAKKIIATVAVASENGQKTVPYVGALVNSKGKTQVQVTLEQGIEADGAKLVAKFAGEAVEFTPFQETWRGVQSMCDEVKGITAEAKEMVITVTYGKAVDTFKFMLKSLDETTLQQITLNSFKIGENEIKDKVLDQWSQNTWRIYNPSSNTIKFTATVDKDLKQAIMVVNGKETIVQPNSADKKLIEAEVEFEKNSTKTIVFVFQADSCKDLNLSAVTLTFTNKLNSEITVEATQRGGRTLTDAEVMSGSVEFSKCMVTEPKIIVKARKNRGAKLTKVTVDGVDVEVKTEGSGENEEYVATYSLNPPLEKAGDKKAVKVHIEGVDAKDLSPKEDTDLEVVFTLVQFIEASAEIKADGKPFVALQENGHRVYSPEVQVKLISKDNDLTEVVVKDYKDADGKIPEFETSGKEATASFKLADTGVAPTTFKVVLSAEGKTDTTKTISIRYTAQNDPLGVGFMQFSQGHVERDKDDEGCAVMVGDSATLFILVNRNVKEFTSMKVNGVEVMNKPAQSDPDKIVTEATMSQTQGPGGTNTNAVFVFGGDKMEQGKAYTLTISLAGKDEDGHVLSETTLPPLKIKQPVFGKDNINWRSPYSSDDMDLIIVSKSHHPDDKAELFWNYYSVQNITFSCNPKNPKAKVKGFWYRHDASCKERDLILADPAEENGTYANHYLTFSEMDTIIGKSKWCATLNLESEEMKGYGISVYLWVVSEDGSKTSKNNKNTDEKYNKIDTVFEQNFRRVDIACSYTKLGNDVGWLNGWDKAIQVTDKAEIDTAQVVDGKVYFRATTFGWYKGGAASGFEMEYHLFNDAPTSPISDFINIDDKPGHYHHDNRFTVDVSSIKDGAIGSEMTVEIPVFMKSNMQGKEFMANVFTRKFKIVKKS